MTKFLRQYLKEMKLLMKEAEKDEYDPKQIILELCESFSINADNLFPEYGDPTKEYEVEIEDINFDDIAEDSDEPEEE